MQKSLFLFSTILCLSLVGTAEAKTILRTGETVSVSEDRGVVGDFYSLASILNVSGKIEGDLVAATGRTTINGEVTEDVLILGGSVDVHGPVGDDVRIIGGEVVLAEPVAGNVFVLGGTVSILSTASIGGDLLVYAGDVEVLGPVSGDILGGYGILRIDSEVSGDIQVQSDSLTLGDNANVAGTISYTSQNLLERAPNAIIGGEILRNDSATAENTTGEIRQYVSGALVLAFATLAWYLLSRKTLSQAVRRATNYSPKPALLGSVLILILPVIIVILFTSLLGSLLALVLLLGYILLLLLGVIAVPAVIGSVLLRFGNHREGTLSLTSLVLGLFVVALLPLLPVVGPILLIAVLLVTIGGILESLYKQISS